MFLTVNNKAENGASLRARARRARRALALIACAALPFAVSPARAEDPALRIIGFADSLALEVDGTVVRLEPGSPAFSIPPGARTKVVSGKAFLLVERTQVRADHGDAFTFLVSAGKGQVLVHEGSLDVTGPGRSSVAVPPGYFVPVTGPEAGVLSVPPPPPQPPKPPEVAAPKWDPLAAIARVTDRISRMRRPKLQLVLELHPYYTLTETYDSNIYLVPPDNPDGTRTGGGVLGSWITAHNLGSKFLLPINRRHRMGAVYDFKWVNYSKQPSANNAVDQVIGVDYEFKGRRGTKGRFYDKYTNTEDPAFSEQVARERRTQQEFGFRLDHERSRKLLLGLAFRDTIHKYLSPSLAASLNRFDLSFGGDVGMRLQPKTRLRMTYRRQIIHYSAGRAIHSKSHRLGFALDGRLAPKITGRATADVQFRKYDVSPGAGGRKITTFLTDIQAVYKAGRRTKVTGRLFRSINESTFGLNRFYVATGISAGVTHRHRKVKVGASASFEADRYPESTTIGSFSANRRDDLYRFGVKTDYSLRPWMTVGLEYERRQRHSIFTGQYNYKADRTSANLKLVF